MAPIRLWEMNDGKQIARANAHGGGVNAIAYTHDGRLVTAGQDRTAKLWDPGLKPLKTFPAFAEPALCVTFTHDGQRVVAGDWSGQVKMWEAAMPRSRSCCPPIHPRLPCASRPSEQQLAAARDAVAKPMAELAAVEQQVSKTSAIRTHLPWRRRKPVRLKPARWSRKRRRIWPPRAPKSLRQIPPCERPGQMVEEAKKALEAATAKFDQTTDRAGPIAGT